eukprot:TRINITY_DN104975_c0_g1_i1.p1 TRINITY_DN104975_c0_g1~~TRINITY_DN104975_c0_g1_i1.p1  ORF type:complete len:526 (-),score=98.77 TRINITY_DN104975_c0_g1_i1:33-1610(-)
MKPFDAGFVAALVCILTSLEVVHAAKLLQQSSARLSSLASFMSSGPSDDAQPLTISDLVRQAEGADDATGHTTEVEKEVASQEPVQQAEGVDDPANQVVEVVKKVPAENRLSGASALGVPIEVSAVSAIAALVEDPPTSDVLQPTAKHPQSEEGDLLQVVSKIKKMDAPGAVREALEENGVADDPNLRKLETSLFGLAKMGDTNSTRMIVDEIRQLVQDVMLPGILNQTRTAEQQVSEIHQRFSQCSNMTSHRLETYPMPNWTDLSAAHKSCRWDQSSMSTPTEELWRLMKDAEGIMNQTCHLYDNVNRMIPGFDECGYPPHNNMRDYIAKLRDKFKVRMEGLNLDRLACENATRIYEHRKRQWMLSSASVNCKKEECDGVQLEMDTAACNYSAAVKSICDEYHHCYNRTRCSYRSTVDTAHDLQERLRPEYRALKRIECILLQWLEDNLDDGIEICRNKTHSVVPMEMNLTGLQVPDLSSCQAPTQPWTILHPTSQEYNQTEYAWLPPNARADSCRAWCCVTPE